MLRKDPFQQSTKSAGLLKYSFDVLESFFWIFLVNSGEKLIASSGNMSRKEGNHE